MATVYLAEDLRHHRKVAVKVLRPELAATLGPDRFLREIELSARLTHPHTLPLHDSGNADGFLYYVMPYVEGESLRDRLTREKQLPLEDALRIACAAHQGSQGAATPGAAFPRRLTVRPRRGPAAVEGIAGPGCDVLNRRKVTLWDQRAQR